MTNEMDMLALVSEIVREETVRLTVYDDATGREIRPGSYVVGHPTIGVGRCIDTAGKGITSEESAYLLQNDIAQYMTQLSLLPWFAKLDPVRQRAIINMRHQLGMVGLLNFRMMIAALNDGEYTLAAQLGLKSAWASQTPGRARRMMTMIETGKAAPSVNVA
jgi:lysozyme